MSKLSIRLKPSGVISGLEAKFRSQRKSSKLFSAEELIKKHEYEEEIFLESIEKKKSLIMAAGTDINNLRVQKKSQTPTETISNENQITPIVKKSSMTDDQHLSATNTKLFGSFCHIMRYVAHLKRQNEQLKLQVVCMDEMRQIEKLQRELVTTAEDSPSHHTDNRNIARAPKTSTKKCLEDVEQRLKSELRHEATTPDKFSVSATLHCGKLAGGRKSNGGQQQPKASTSSGHRLDGGASWFDPCCPPSQGSAQATGELDGDHDHSKTPEDPKISPKNFSSSLSVSPMSCSFSEFGNSTNKSNSSMSSNYKARKDYQWLTIPKRSIQELGMANARRIRLSAEEALAEPLELGMATTNGTNTLTFGTSADFSAGSIFSLSDQESLQREKNSCFSYTNGNQILESEEDDDKSAVFAEVDLPDVPKQVKSLPTSKIRAKNDHTNSVRSVCSEILPVEWDKKKSKNKDMSKQRLSHTNSLLEKLGLRQSRAKTPNIENMNGRKSSKIFVIDKEETNLLDKSDDLIKKPIFRKRKRKISESDSIASQNSENSKHGVNGNTNKIIEVNDRQKTANLYQDLKKRREGSLRKSQTKVNSVQNAFSTQNQQKMDQKICTKRLAKKNMPNVFFPDDNEEENVQWKNFNNECTATIVKESNRLSVAANQSMSSNANSHTNLSNDSVFMSNDHEEINDDGMTKQLVELQERNCNLIQSLRDKSREYDQITDQLSSLEKEVVMLRHRYTYENVVERMVQPEGYVPVVMLDNLQEEMKTMDHGVRRAKTDALKSQQLVMDSFVKEQSICRKYLDQIENLQKQNLRMMQSEHSDPLNPETTVLESIDDSPNYEELYKHTSNTVKKLQQLRFRLLEKSCSTSKVEMELINTQSSLLLAHAQIERQKVEFGQMQRQKGRLRRVQSFHGQDLLARKVKDHLCYYLPFKLHGSKLHDFKKFMQMNNEDGKDLLLYDEECERSVLEQLLRLRTAQNANLVKSNKKSSAENGLGLSSNPTVRRLKRLNNVRPYSSYSDTRNDVMDSIGTVPKTNLGTSFSNPNSNISLFQQRPTSFHSCVPEEEENNVSLHAKTSVKNAIDESKSAKNENSRKSGIRTPTKLALKSKMPKSIPTLLKLGNCGQVRTMAAVFNRQNQDTDSSASPPTTINHVGFRKMDNQRSERHVANDIFWSDLKTPSKIPIKNRLDYNVVNLLARLDNSTTNRSPVGSDSSSNLSIGNVRTYETLQFKKYVPDSPNSAHSNWAMHAQIESTRQRILNAFDDQTLMIGLSQKPPAPKGAAPKSPVDPQSPVSAGQPIGSPFFRAVLRNLKNAPDIRSSENCLRSKKSAKSEETTKKRRSWFLMFKNKK